MIRCLISGMIQNMAGEVEYQSSEKRQRPVLVRIILLGVIGGPVAGGIFGVAFWAVAGFFASFTYSVDLAQILIFTVAGLVVGALVGLVCGVCCSIVSAAGYLISQKFSGAVRASTSGILAGTSAVVLSYLAIGPVLATFNPAIFAVVLGPIVGLAYFAVSFRRGSRSAELILQP